MLFDTGHCLSENFYVRGDGTRVYFFTQGKSFCFTIYCKGHDQYPLIKSVFLPPKFKLFFHFHELCIGYFDWIFSEELREMMTKAGLTEEQNHIDRRLQVNRGRQLKMYRVWIQCKYRK